MVGENAMIFEFGISSFVLYVATGGIVGFAVGVTGVGGGSLMTPALLLYGFPAPVAIGTDLLFAAITKIGGAGAHARLGNIDYRILARLAAGSVPGALLALTLLAWLASGSAADHEMLLTHALGFMLICTALALACKGTIDRWRPRRSSHPPAGEIAPTSAGARRQRLRTVTLGFLLGVLVTFSSVGTGAVAAAVLMLLYPTLSARRVVGTDIAHAVPLTLIAGLGHLSLGHVDLLLLLALLCGSLPAIRLGAQVAARLPDLAARGLLVTLLAALGGWLVAG